MLRRRMITHLLGEGNMPVNLDDLFSSQLASSHQQGSGLTAMADRNLSQGLGVINSALIQAQGSVSDDPGLIAALQTASRAPRQGANDDAKA
jgi:hypothetical protein